MAFYAPARSPLAHSYSPLLLEGVIEVCQAQGQGTGTLDLHGACQHPILEEYVGWWISCCPLWEIDPATGGLQRSSVSWDAVQAGGFWSQKRSESEK